MKSQTLIGTDGLGRVLPATEHVGLPKDNRHVAVFYFLWQGHGASVTSETHWDLDKLYTHTSEVFRDFNHPGWGGGATNPGRYYYWGEPVYGYYKGDDYWVHLKNIQLLTDAAVDILIIDATNRITYPLESDALMRAMEAVRKQGKNPPKIVYYTNTASGDAMQEIYDNYYKPGALYRYPESWFYLEGKPLIIGLSKDAQGRDYENYFTIRESQWPNESQKINGWPWIEFQRPQYVYENHLGQREIVNVSAAQHPNLDACMGGSAFYGQSGNWGRSFRNGHSGNPEKDMLYGYNIQEQWDFALKQDVPFVFVTGWNEWIAGKWRRTIGDTTQALFVDQASPEYSRDIEPTRTAGLKDHYYMQMVANIRRYKGVEAQQVLGASKTIRTWTDWDEVYPEYHDYVGDIIHRSHRGAQSDPITQYANTTGRNDFELMKVARDRKNIYFYVQCANTISGNRTANNWMALYIDIDRSHATGWQGYDFRVVSGNKLQRYTDGCWQDIKSLTNKLDESRLMLTIPRKILQMKGKDFEFKWIDNMQEEEPLDWYVNGDVAPGGRFNFWVRGVD
ncbi:hypothetical protein [Sphingobacterium sp. FBM7-1]|uniref:hypothetical protein n=1 Tax=Sphingobacterium sp. FBM7-1 TaxID=2886688 RepID=UPI001D1195BC|nr:hypothetical protein [Sphingobacterium sp. FBM7-1]MCC2599916.1 hypothetical protein [Sphingobacterium sp. FBM7-1]